VTSKIFNVRNHRAVSATAELLVTGKHARSAAMPVLNILNIFIHHKW